MLSRNNLQKYQRLINGLAARAQSEVTRAAASGASNADLIRIIDRYRGMAFLASDRFYGGLKRAQTGQIQPFRMPRFSHDAVEIDRLLSNSSHVGRTSDWLVRCAVRDTMWFNGMRDPDRPRFAIIPAGDACEWCVMLASRGFVYWSDQTAAASLHANCRCAIVPSWERSPRVEGYNPGRLYGRYNAVHKSVPSRRVGESERDFTLRLMAEARFRDKAWLNGGKIPRVDLNGQSPLAKELSTANRLANNGVGVRFLPRSYDARTPDIMINGRTWEIKQPTGSGGRNISNQFNEAKGQSSRLVIDATSSPHSTRYIEEQVQRQLSLRDDFTEVIVVRGNSYFRRFKK